MASLVEEMVGDEVGNLSIAPYHFLVSLKVCIIFLLVIYSHVSTCSFFINIMDYEKIICDLIQVKFKGDPKKKLDIRWPLCCIWH
jgi:hypothetical protein